MRAIHTMLRRTLALVVLATIACEGSTGPVGPPGADGPQGPPGSANVVLFQFTGSNFNTQPSRTLTIPVTQQEMNESAWLVYLVRPTGLVFHIPGPGLNGTTQYRAWHSWSTSAMSLHIAVSSGPGEEYASIRVIRIAAGAMGNSQPSHPAGLLPAGFDVADYQAVVRHYGLDER